MKQYMSGVSWDDVLQTVTLENRRMSFFFCVAGDGFEDTNSLCDTLTTEYYCTGANKPHNRLNDREKATP
jgi:hypothetical protein